MLSFAGPPRLGLGNSAVGWRRHRQIEFCLRALAFHGTATESCCGMELASLAPILCYVTIGHRIGCRRVETEGEGATLFRRAEAAPWRPVPNCRNAQCSRHRCLIELSEWECQPSLVCFARFRQIPTGAWERSTKPGSPNVVRSKCICEHIFCSTSLFCQCVFLGEGGGRDSVGIMWESVQRIALTLHFMQRKWCSCFPHAS